MTWSFVLIPDTQHLATPADGLTGYYNGLRDWIVANVATHDIQFVGGLGDIVHEYGDAASWANAETALLPLFDLDIPVLLFAAGNHDTNTSSQTTRNLSIYNASLPTTLYSGKPWFGGVFESGKAQNMYANFTVGGHDYLAFSLEFYPRAAVLEWVESVAAAHPTHRALICTHAYLYMTGVRDTWSVSPYGPSHYFTNGVDDAHSGDEMWSWFRTIPGLFGVFNGHHIYNNVAYRTDAGDDGNLVLQGFYNWQEYGQGGRGRVVLMTVDETAGTIRQQVVRTDLDSFEAGSSGVFDYDHTHNIWPSALPAGRYGFGGSVGVNVGGTVKVYSA